MTECIQSRFDFQGPGKRTISAAFNGGKVTSDAGGLLLKEVDDRFGFIRQFAACFTDHRSPQRCQHPLEDLLRQRIFALCLGYEDLNDHDTLRQDPLLAAIVGKEDPAAENALAGKSTLNRLELTPARADASSRYQKIAANLGAIQEFLVEAFLTQHGSAPERIILDVDTTDDPIHGHQLGRFFHGYYDQYCFLPLYIFSGDHPLLALLRPGDIDGATGLVKHLARIVARLRQAWPGVSILVRGDSGFCRDHLLAWCEENNVDYIVGLAKNSRLIRILGKESHEAKEIFEQTREPARVFKDFTYQTRKSWSRERRVVGKGEHLAKGANPRFVVTSLSPEAFDARTVYEDLYCSRGEMENRIKEQQLCLFADRTSCQTMRANQLRLAFSTVAYVLLRALREFGLGETKMSQARVDTIRLRVLKIGAVVKVTVRKIWVAMSESCPWQETFAAAYRALTAWRSPAAVPA